MTEQRNPRVPAGTKGNRTLIGPLMEFAAAAVRNETVDPVTTELVRLTCAEYHDCHT
jgi:hypothetical protein